MEILFSESLCGLPVFLWIIILLLLGGFVRSIDTDHYFENRSRFSAHNLNQRPRRSTLRPGEKNIKRKES